MLRRLTLDALYILFADAGARLLAFFATIYLARTLGPEAFGLVVVGSSVLLYAMWCADLGLATLGTREMAQPPSRRGFTPGEILSARLALATGVCLLGQGMLALLPVTPLAKQVLQLYLLYLPVDALTVEWYYRGVRRYLPITVARWCGGMLYVGLVIYLVHRPAQVVRVPLLYTAAYTVSALLLLAGIIRKDGLRFRPLRLSRYREMIGQAISIGLGAIAAQVVTILPPIVLALWAGAESAGLFGAALRVVTILLMADRVFVALFLPAISRLWASQPESAPRRLQALFKIVLFGSAALCTAVTLGAPAIISWLYTADYTDSAPTLMLLGWFVLPTLLNSLFSFTLIAMKRESLYFHATVKGGIIAAVCIGIAGALWGAPGAAAGVVSGEIAIVAFVYRAFRRFHRIAPGKPLLLAAGLTGLALIAAPATGISGALGAPITAALYLIAVVLFRGITGEEVRTLLQPISGEMPEKRGE